MNYEQAKEILDKLLNAGEASKNERDAFTIDFLKDAGLSEKEKMSLLLSIKKKTGEWHLATHISKLNDNDKIKKHLSLLEQLLNLMLQDPKSFFALLKRLICTGNNGHHILSNS